MSFLQLEQVTKRYGRALVIEQVQLEAERGEFVVFVGPSGCGKSTLLRMIAGLEDVSGGQIRLDGRDVTLLEPAAREVAMVFQSYALFPHMTVAENIGFGLRMARTPRPELERRVGEAARILRIEELLTRKPRALSGGQRQRVAIGRAIVKKPKLFLFDEPLSNLDAELRAQMRVEVARLHRDLGATMVYVTHDQVEAMTLADRIVVLRAGRIEQIGPPAELYDRPANRFVAQFIGSPKMNLIGVTILEVTDRLVTLGHPAFAGGRLQVPPRREPVGSHDGLDVGATLSLGIRPEHLSVTGEGPARLELVAEFAEDLGGTSQIYGETAPGEPVVVSAPGRVQVARGQKLTLGLDPGRCHLFDGAGRAI